MRPLLMFFLVVFAMLVSVGVFNAAYRFLRHLGGPPESDTGLWVQPPGEAGDEDV